MKCVHPSASQRGIMKTDLYKAQAGSISKTRLLIVEHQHMSFMRFPEPQMGCPGLAAAVLINPKMTDRLCLSEGRGKGLMG